MFNPDFKDMLSALSDNQADFLVVGAYAMAVHGHPRATGDLDLWVRPNAENAIKVFKALAKFGAAMHDLAISDLSSPGIVFQIGVEPSRIDILTSISGVDFFEAWERRRSIQLDGVVLSVIGLADLIVNKRASGRPKDIADVFTLTRND